jgi:hypothetical protein
MQNNIFSLYSIVSRDLTNMLFQKLEIFYYTKANAPGGIVNVSYAEEIAKLDSVGGSQTAIKLVQSHINKPPGGRGIVPLLTAQHGRIAQHSLQ